MRRLAVVALGVLLAPSMSSADPEAVGAGPAPICHSAPPATDATPAPAQKILTGYGTGGFLVRTHNAGAQAFFDNGMQLGHAFAHKASIAAFKEARRLDPGCAMCVWGEAWSRGPTINYGIGKTEEKALAKLADEAAGLAKDGPAKERLLTQALQARYRPGGALGFARAMDAVARAYPDDNEIAVLTADAWMVAWNGKARQANLPRAVALLEGALARNPSDTGAIHFYIHATEMSGFGTRALPYAQKLQGLAPAASHLVHMPSHTYFWAGWYQQAAQSNLDAVALDEANAVRLSTPVWDLSYHGHNVQFGMGAALMSGDGQAALKLAAPVLARLGALKPNEAWPQFGMRTAYFVQGRFADPAAVLALPDPGAGLPYTRAMWRYARGEALARREDAAGVRDQAAQIGLSKADLKPFGDSAAQASAMAAVARLVLLGRAAMLDGRHAEAISSYRQAALLQEGKFGEYRDPPAFWYPVRRSLAAALLADGQAGQAAIEAKASLDRWPSDAVALVVLGRAEEALGRGDAAKARFATARKAFKGDPEQVKAALA
jgi:tetratricopeptide (TPR) repeat protein